MSAGDAQIPNRDYHAQAALWCVRLAGGRLGRSQQREMDAWLDESPEHRRALEAAAAVWREFEGVEVRPDFLPGRVEALAAMGRPPPQPSRMHKLLAAVVAVALLGSVGAAAWMRVTAPVSYVTQVGERRVAVLPDGSKISLDGDTVVRVRYTRHGRDLRLVQGRAKFAVAKDPLRPFAVTAADKTVVATGTEFSVELLRKDVHVVLFEGRVAVLEGASHRAKAPVRLSPGGPAADGRLTPGVELVAAQRSGGATIARADPAEILAWEAGQLVFIDEPLFVAVERMNRYSAARLVVEGDAAQARISGVFAAGDTNAFIEGVSTALAIRAEARRDAIVFTTAGPKG